MFIFVFASIDKVILTLRRYRKAMVIIRMELAERRQREADAKAGRGLERRVTMYRRKCEFFLSDYLMLVVYFIDTGFAFAQESG